MLTVHYIFDPMCGWCYGATELMAELQAREHQGELRVALHPGGMIPRRAMDESFRLHVLRADKRIAELTGMEFGEAYLQRVASGAPTVLDSMITSQAVLAAQSQGLDGAEMLKAIQKAHYWRGLNVAEETTLSQLAVEQGADPQEWDGAMRRGLKDLDRALEKTRQIMNRFGVQGFPTFLLEHDGGWNALPHQQYYGDLAGWKRLLDSLLEVA